MSRISIFRFLCALGLMALPLLVACSDSDSDNEEETPSDGDAVEDGDQVTDDDDDSSGIDGDEDGDEQEQEESPVMPLALCDMPDYDLAPTSETGLLIDWKEDPFYNLEAETVDSLLTNQGYGALSPIPYGCRVFLFRYTTQDRGQVVEATAVLGIPANADVEGLSFPTALFLHGTTGFADVCAPGRLGDGQLEGALLGSLGFIAVAPDYIGMTSFGDPSTAHHAYLSGEQVAIGSWDALRAAKLLLATEELKDAVRSSDQTVVWGGSQGGHAALFTELYAPYYAPEFDVAAVVAMVPPSDLLSLANIAVSEFGPPTSAFLAVLTTLRAWYGAPESMAGVIINEEPYFLADNAERFVFMEGMEECDAGDILNEGRLYRGDGHLHRGLRRQGKRGAMGRVGALVLLPERKFPADHQRSALARNSNLDGVLRKRRSRCHRTAVG